MGATDSFQTAAGVFRAKLDRKKCFSKKPVYDTGALCRQAVQALNLCTAADTQTARDFSADQSFFHHWQDSIEALCARLNSVASAFNATQG
ncbi:MAG: hypothetical protein QM689_12860 [Oscillospiraceae bacterium]